MKDVKKFESTEKSDKLIEGIDYFFEAGLMVLTAPYLLKRGYCCQNGCRNCPYRKEEDKKL
jgi:RAB protein geranylgeranyltransferase component A